MGGRERQPNEPVHDMWIRVTIDLDMKIHEIEASTDSGPYPICGNIDTQLQGARRRHHRSPAGARRSPSASAACRGCTHLVELLGPLGTTAFQATGRARQARSAGKPLTKKPYQLNSCHVYKDDGPAVLERWPQFYTGKR